MDKETNVGKCDFDYTYNVEEEPSLALSEWMRKDLDVFLYSSLPVIKQIKNEEDDSTRDEVVMDAEGLPVVQRQILRKSLWS